MWGAGGGRGAGLERDNNDREKDLFKHKKGAAVGGCRCTRRPSCVVVTLSTELTVSFESISDWNISHWWEYFVDVLIQDRKDSRLSGKRKFPLNLFQCTGGPYGVRTGGFQYVRTARHTFYFTCLNNSEI